MIKPETIREFQKTVKKEYGVEMSDAEASESLRNLVGFFDLLMKIDARNKKNETTEKN